MSLAACAGRFKILVLAFAALAAAGFGTAAAAPGRPGDGPVVDHHLHLGSPALQDHIDRLRALDPASFDHLSPDLFSRPSAQTALSLLDEAGVRRAVLLSSGYLFLVGAQPADMAAAEQALREENRFVVNTALAAHGRFVAFIAINPFAPHALEELDYWKGRPGVSGIKLHLGAAGFHASAPEQVARLAALFGAARMAGLPLVVHLRGGGPFPRSEVETFIDQVLSQAGDLPVQIAHGGGYAGADAATIESIRAFGAAIAHRAPGTRNLVFDLSGVVMPDDLARVLGADDAQLAAYVTEMRRIGLKRFVLASDWPAIAAIAPYFALVRRKLPVTDAEWRRLCANQAPYLGRRR